MRYTYNLDSLSVDAAKPELFNSLHASIHPNIIWDSPRLPLVYTSYVGPRVGTAGKMLDLCLHFFSLAVYRLAGIDLGRQVHSAETLITISELFIN